MKSRAIIFDAYGTLFDVNSVLMGGEHGIDGDQQVLSRLSDMWRRRQLERTWLLSLMERYEDFGKITEAALRAAGRESGLDITEMQVEKLMRAYRSPDAFPEVRAALESLAGTPLGILSNGTSEMIEATVRHNGLGSFFQFIISVDRVKTYKPSPRVYALGPDTFEIPAAEILFVSSNAWDAAGAKAFGYRVCWCNRSGTAADNLGFAPDFTVSGLDRLSL
jgi:2-haloacid dehalogenase